MSEEKKSAQELMRSAVSKAEKVFAKKPLQQFVSYSSEESNINGKKTSFSQKVTGEVKDGVVSYNVKNSNGDNYNKTIPVDVVSSSYTTDGRTADYNGWGWQPNWWDIPWDWTWHYPTILPKETTIEDAKKMLRDIDDLINHVPNKLPKEIVSNSFPPTNIFITEDKNLHIEASLAGYTKEEISLSFDEDYIILNYKPIVKEYKNEEEKEKLDEAERPIDVSYIQKGIKKIEGETKYYIDPKKWDGSQAKVSFVNGNLNIEIPKDDTVKEKQTLLIE
jgi:HSP20 family molecular chaperone IbpA